MISKIKGLLARDSSEAVLAKLEELRGALPKAEQDVADALATVGERVLYDGEGNANASGTLRAARERLDGLRAAIGAAEARLAVVEAAEQRQRDAQRWSDADQAAAELVRAGQDLDAALAAVAPRYTALLDAIKRLHVVSPVGLENFCGAGRVKAVLPLAMERVGIESGSTWRLMHGELVPPPGAADFCREAMAYLESRKPVQLRKEAAAA
jgi:hypothetical protein